jgi:hypothetical protein
MDPVAWQSSCTIVTRFSEVFVAPFPSYTHYIAPSLRLFGANSLMLYHLFLSEVCAFSICSESHSHSQLLGFLNNNNLFIIIIIIIIILEQWSVLWCLCQGWMWTGSYHAIKKLYKEKCDLEPGSLSGRTFQVSVCTRTHTHTHTECKVIVLCALEGNDSSELKVHIKFCNFNSV